MQTEAATGSTVAPRAPARPRTTGKATSASGLTPVTINALKPQERPYKVTDRDGMYVHVTSTGAKSFRYDYRLNGRRETLVLGPYMPNLVADGAAPRAPEEIQYGHPLTLADARMLRDRAHRSVMLGQSPAKAKAEAREHQRAAQTFKAHADAWLDTRMADSTRDMRRGILNRDILPHLGNKLLPEISTAQVLKLCEAIRDRGAPAPAVQVRKIISLVYGHARDRGLDVVNPAAAIKPSAIATFVPRDRALAPEEMRIFFRTVEQIGTQPTLRLAVKFILLTMCRKGELLNAQWSEVNFEAATWTIPAERMKARWPHVVYLSRQALDILVAFKTCAGSSEYLLPSRYDNDQPMSKATINRVIDAAVAKAQQENLPLESFSVHDLRRTASTLLHEAGFNTDWIEKCLAHEQKGVRAVYNKAEYASQRRDMLQQWADMVDQWTRGVDVVPIGAARKSA